MAAIQIYQDENAVVQKFYPRNIYNRNSDRAVLQPLYHKNAIQNLKDPINQEEEVEPVLFFDVDEIPIKVPKLCSNIFTPQSSLKLIELNLIEKEYENEIRKYLKKREQLYKIKPIYMKKQLYLSWNMRSTLIDWLVTVSEEYKMNSKCIHLCVNYIDRFLSSISVVREKFQLVGATAMMIAGKFEEIYPPNINDWSYLTDGAFTPAQIIKMEKLMLKVLNFDINPPTVLDFIGFLCAKHKIDIKTMYLAQYLSELVLAEGEHYVQYLPSKLAAASLALARYNLFKKEPWNKNLQQTAGYSLQQLSPVVHQQQKTLINSPNNANQAVQKKYSNDRYKKVALLKPRTLLTSYDIEQN